MTDEQKEAMSRTQKSIQALEADYAEQTKQNEADWEAEQDRVYMSGMDRSRVYIAAGFIVLGIIIAFPMIPGAVPALQSLAGAIGTAFTVSWDFLAHMPSHLSHWHFRMLESGPVMVYRLAAGIITGVVTAFSLRHGWRVALLRGGILMAVFVVLRWVIF